jgi:hypothetical protein
MRREPQLLKPGELDYIMQTAKPGNECLLIEHIAAMYQERDRLVDSWQRVRLITTTADGYGMVAKLKRIQVIADSVLGAWR